MFCPNTKCSMKFFQDKKTFESLGRRNYQCPQCASMCQVRKPPFKGRTNTLISSFGKGAYILGESPKSIQDVIEDVLCPGKYCFNRVKCESFDGYVTTLRSIYACGKCGTWLFLHKVPFMLQEQVKTTKTDKTRFFFAKKGEIVTPQTIVH